MRAPQPAVAAVLSFIDAINRGDVERLGSLMAPDHRLHVLDEAPFDGLAANIAAWTGYTTAFPEYLIYPHRIEARGEEIIVLGRTTGSHLGLPDEDELRHRLARDAVQ